MKNKGKIQFEALKVLRTDSQKLTITNVNPENTLS